MAELALGVLGLSGLFTAALEVWTFVDAGRNFTIASENFLAKLDLQRRLFIIWGHNMGFRSPCGYSRFLDDPRIRPSIELTLNKILQLWSDTEALSEKYGINIDNSGAFESAVVPSNPLYESFKRTVKAAFRRGHEQSFIVSTRQPSVSRASPSVVSGVGRVDLAALGTPQKRQDTTSIWNLVSWAFCDASKAEQLINDLTYFVKGLYDITDRFPSASRHPESNLNALCFLNRLSDPLSRGELTQPSQKRSIPRFGLSVIYEPGYLKPIVDIIFVCGFEGHPYHTWASQDSVVAGSSAPVEAGDLRSDSVPQKRKQASPVGAPKFMTSRWLKRRRLDQQSLGGGRVIPAGVNGNAPLDGSHFCGEDSVPDVFWPGDLLPAECPDARISTLGVACRGHSWDDTLLEWLQSLTNFRPPGRRVVFVVHSTGGLFIRELLLRASASSSTKHQDLIRSTAGVVFMGTPQAGTDLVYINCLASEKRACGSLDMILQLPGQLCWSIDPVASRDPFLKVWRTYDFRVKTFQECPAQDGHGQVIPDSCSKFGDPREMAEALASNHARMTKFRGFQDSDYCKVSDALREMYLDLHANVSDLLARLNIADPVASPSPIITSNHHESTIEPYLRSLHFKEMRNRRAAISAPVADTCKWLLRNEQFQSWLHRRHMDQDMGVLVIKGKPGSGKSIAMKAISANMALQTDPETIVITFFFNAKGVSLERSKVGMLRSLSYQLLQNDPSTLSVMETLFSDRVAGPPTSVIEWTSNDLESFLCEVFQRKTARRVIILADALDECDKDDASGIAWVIRNFAMTAQKSGFPLNICISTRPFPSIPLGNTCTILMEHHNRDDIKTFVLAKFAAFALPENQGWEELKESIVRRSTGVFLWVSLVFETILKAREAGLNLITIQQSLGNLPNELEALYRNVLLSSLPECDVAPAIKLFQWVVFGLRPLRLREWHHVMMLIRRESPYRSLKEYDGSSFVAENDEDLVRQIRQLSAGLVEVVSVPDSEATPASGHDHDSSILPGAGSLDFEHGETRLVQVIHESVREFFVRGDGFRCLDSSYANSPMTAHYSIINCCLHYLRLQDWDDLAAARKKAELTSSSPPRASSMENRRTPGPSYYPTLQSPVDYPAEPRQRVKKRSQRPSSVRSFQSAGSSPASIGSGHSSAGLLDVNTYLDIEHESLLGLELEDNYAHLHGARDDHSAVFHPAPSGTSPNKLFRPEFTLHDDPSQAAVDTETFNRRLLQVNETVSQGKDYVLHRYIEGLRDMFHDDESPLPAIFPREASLASLAPGSRDASCVATMNERPLAAQPPLLDYASYRPFDHALAAEKHLDEVNIDLLRSTISRISENWERLLSLREDLPHDERLVIFCTDLGLDSWASHLLNGERVSPALFASSISKGPRAVRYFVLKDVEMSGSADRVVKPLLHQLLSTSSMSGAEKWLAEVRQLLVGGELSRATLDAYLQSYGLERSGCLVLALGALERSQETRESDVSNALVTSAWFNIIEQLLQLGVQPRGQLSEQGHSPVAFLCSKTRFLPKSAWQRLFTLLVSAEAKKTPTPLSGDNGIRLHRLLNEKTGVDMVLLTLLLEHGADVNAVNAQGDTAMHFLISRACTWQGLRRARALEKALPALCHYGADVSMRGKLRRTPLNLAIFKRSWRAAELLLQHSAKPMREDVRSLLRRTAELRSGRRLEGSSEVDMLGMMIRAGYPVDSKDSSSRTALHAAASISQPHMVRALLGHGANIQARTASGDTPLHSAIGALGRRRMDEVFATVGLLVVSGANVNAQNQAGQTAFDLAEKAGGCPEEILHLLCV